MRVLCLDRYVQCFLINHYVGGIILWTKRIRIACIGEYCDNRLEEVTQRLIDTKCNANVEDIAMQSAQYTSNRRKRLRQQRELKLLQKEEEKGDEEDVKMKTNHEIKKKKKKEVIVVDDEEEEEEALILPKKRKANLNSFGFGRASQNLRESAIDSQQNEDIKDEKRANKKRKLSGGNDVLNSLLGLDGDDDDEDEDVDIEMNSNCNKKSDRVLRSQREVSNTQKSLDQYGISIMSQQQSQRKRKSVVNTQNANANDDDEEDEEMHTQRRRRQKKKSAKQKSSGWGSLLSRRANR
eukprot:692590_1